MNKPEPQKQKTEYTIFERLQRQAAKKYNSEIAGERIAAIITRLKKRSMQK